MLKIRRLSFLFIELMSARIFFRTKMHQNLLQTQPRMISLYEIMRALRPTLQIDR
jgi:hypothetical protein